MKKTGLLISALVIALATALQAQLTKGSISGTVVDATGAVVTAAQITAREAQTGSVYETATDKNGNFRFQLIPPGNYTLEVKKEGFSNLTQSGVLVNSSVDAGVGLLHLSVGLVTDAIEVSGAAPLVETTQSQVTNTFQGAELQQFAGIGENEGLDNLALYVPGVTAARADNLFANTNGTGFSANGIRQRANDQQIDGQNNNDNSVTGPALFVTDNEFVGEYQVITNQFGPEYGRNAGSVVNISTKSGTNAYHGSLYGTENNNVLNSMDNINKFFLQQKHLPYLNDEFSGGTFGGPIKRNKLFFFAGFNNEIIDESSIFSTGQLSPTLAGLNTLAGCFPGNANVATLQKYSAFGVKLGSVGVVPGSTITDTVPGCGAVEFASPTRSLSAPTHTYDVVARGDYQGQKDSLFLRYLFNQSTAFNLSTGTPANAAAGYVFNEPARSQAARIDWTRNVTDKMVNQVAISYGREVVEFGGGNPFTPSTADIGNAVTSINFNAQSTMLAFGPPNVFPQGRIVNTYQVQDNYRIAAGNHQLKAGVNWTYQRSPNVFLPNFNGSFTYNGGSSPGAAVGAFLANTPTTFSITSGSPFLDFREYDTFLYFGDDWKVTPHLTLNLGLTYDYFGQPENIFHSLDTRRETGSNPFWNPSLPLSVRTAAEIPSYKRAFGPGVGFAWAPGDSKTVLRGGYRLAYDPPFYNIYTNESSAAPQVLAVTQSVRGAVVPLPANPIGSNVRAALSSLLPLGTLDPRSKTSTNVSAHFHPDNYSQYTLGVQRELSRNSSAELRYVGNHGSSLIQTIDANPFIADLAANFPNLVPSGVTPCSAANAAVPGDVGREFCNAPAILRQRANTGYSNYNALQAEFRAANLFHQLTLRSTYTWSRSLDNVSDIFGTFASGTTTAIAQNPLNVSSGDYGPSQYDIPHNFTVNLVEQIPFFKSGNGLLGHVLGGWSVAGSYILGSGVPYTPVQGFLEQSIGSLNGGDFSDQRFQNAFNLGFENLRPFVSSMSAPASTIGIFAGDACALFGAGCGAPATTLLNFNALNACTSAAIGTCTQTLNANQVRFIVNAATSEGVFGTPFGNARRNSLRDYKTNIANAALYKTVKVNERVQLQFTATLLNAFNHPNYYSVDPLIDDGGLSKIGTGFGDPRLFSSGNPVTDTVRKALFGIRIHF